MNLRRRFAFGAADWLAGNNGSLRNDKEIMGYSESQWEFIWNTMLVDGAWAVPSITDFHGNIIKENIAPELMLNYIAHDLKCHIIVFDLVLDRIQFISGNHLKKGNVVFDSPLLVYATGSHFQSVFQHNHEFFVNLARDMDRDPALKDLPQYNSVFNNQGKHQNEKKIMCGTGPILTASSMEINVKNIRAGKISKIGCLEIKIHQKVSPDHYIVGDQTEKMLLLSGQNLKEGACYKLIKPSYKDKKLKKNQTFSAVKLQKDIKADGLKADEAQIFEAELDTDTRNVQTKITYNFDVVEALGVGGVVEQIKLMIVSKSSIIAGKFGNYRIVTCRDIRNQKNSINLHRNLQDLVEVGGIYNFININVNNFKKDEEKFFRLGTTYMSKIFKASANDKKEFDEVGVLLGDAAAKGSIAGISELNIYESCEVCWCKLDGNGFCRKCNKKIDKKKKDFNLVMYIEVEKQHNVDADISEKEDDNDEDILSIFCFKSTLNLKNLEDMEITEEKLNDLWIGNKCGIQYNFQSDGKHCRLVKFTMK